MQGKQIMWIAGISLAVVVAFDHYKKTKGAQ